MKKKVLTCLTMGCLRLIYSNQHSPLIVVHRKTTSARKVVQSFMSVDPLADDPRNVSWSPYTYTWNNPLKFTDPTGMIGTNGYEEQEDGSWKQVNTIGGDNHHTYQYRNGDVMYLDKTSKGWVNSFVLAKERNADVASRNNTSGVAFSMTGGQGNETKTADKYTYENIDDAMVGAEAAVTHNYGLNLNEDDYNNAWGHYDDNVTPNVMQQRDVVNVVGSPRVENGFLLSKVSQRGDSVSHITFDPFGNAIDTSTFRAIKPRSVFHRRNWHPTTVKVPGIVQNPR